MALRDAGWTIVNLACGLGRPDQRSRRQAELREACRLAGFELRTPPSSSLGDRDPAEAAAELTELAAEAIGELDPRIVVSPGPGDRHPAHRVACRAVHDALGALGPRAPHWWMWALWGSLPQPTLGTLFGSGRLKEILAALAAHRVEIARNDYRKLVRARAEMHASLAPELLFGFGSRARAGEAYAELLTEAVLTDGRWLLGRPRWLDPGDPLGDPGEAEAIVAD
jgi:LmbE family N-acetylglucosaminyl deacetylase